MQTSRRILVATVVAASTLMASGAAAGADPPGFPVVLECGSGTYDALLMGNGAFAPGHDAASNAIFHPVAFPGDFHGTILDAEGAVVDSFTEPDGGVRGNGGKNKTIDECTYDFVIVGDGSDPFLAAGHTFLGGGNVNGYWSPPQR